MNPGGAITLKESGSKGRYVYRAADDPEADMTFSKAGASLTITQKCQKSFAAWVSACCW